MEVGTVTNKKYCQNCGGIQTFVLDNPTIAASQLSLPTIRRALDYPELFVNERICPCLQSNLIGVG